MVKTNFSLIFNAFLLFERFELSKSGDRLKGERFYSKLVGVVPCFCIARFSYLFSFLEEL
jgi:hypothetical protein